MMNDLIAAISTPPGEGAIGIIRLSGQGAIDLLGNIFRPYHAGLEVAERKNYALNLGWIIEANGDKIDEVLVSIMRGPHSYTAEDVVEINCHGGSVAIRRCLQRSLDLGARLAEPGEFTKRAYLNGRLELSQAEAVMELIRAKTDRGLKLALQELEGKSGQVIAELEGQLLHLNAMVNASLDFPDEVGEINQVEAITILQEVIGKIDHLLLAGKRAEVYRDGAQIAICGKPNVGKSSLLNALVQKEKAIVTAFPGTTRDVIEEYINIRGIPVKIMDTAGIRETEDLVEKIGVERSKDAIARADLVIFVLDYEAGISAEDMDIFNTIPPEKILILVNKEDILVKEISQAELETRFAGITVIRSSVKEEIGLDALEKSIEEKVLRGELVQDGMEIMINLRQREALLKSREHAASALGAMAEMPLDCLAVDIWGALERLGELTGKALKEDIIDRIFHDFCIGK